MVQDTLTGPIGKVDGSGVSNTGLWEIGSFYGANYLNGKLAELMVIPSVLSEEDRQNLEGYLAHKWGLTDNLPTDHPYKDNPQGSDGFPYTFQLIYKNV